MKPSTARAFAIFASIPTSANKPNHVFPSLLLCLLIYLPSLAVAGSFNRGEDFDRLMKDLIAEFDVPGATLAISRHGKLVYAKGFGYADIETGEKMQPDHLFRISSVSKPVTAVAVMRLVEQGKLKLSDRVYELIGEFPMLPGTPVNKNIYRITIEDLLRHSSGQAIYNSNGRISSPMQPPISRHISRQFNTSHPPALPYVIGYMASQPLLNPAGSHYKYSNFGYALLGQLIEKVTNMPYEQYVNQGILNQIGIQCMKIGRTLRNQKHAGEVSYYDLNIKSRDRRASVIDGEPGDIFPYAGRHIEGWGAAGAWIASSIDIVRFINHVDGRRSPAILRPPSIRKMLRQQKMPEHRRKGFWYGLGWRIQKKGDGHHWYHNGSSNSGAAAIMLRAANGVAWSAHFNKRLPPGRALYKKFNKAMWKLTKSTRSWPKTDLFPQYESCHH